MNSTKKFLISLFIILTLLSAFALYKVSYAIVTPEMDATGISLRGKNEGDTVNYTLNDLYSRYDIFCCQHGTYAFIDGQEIINIGGRTFDVTSSTNKGSILLDETFYNNNTPSDFKSGKQFTTVSNPKYVITERKTATPKEAYILSEMEENVLYGDRLSNIYEIELTSGAKVPANIKDSDITKTFEAIDQNGVLMTVYSIEKRDDDGRIISATFYIKEGGLFYKVKLNNEISTTAEYGILSYVQNAWWTTDAGNKGKSVTPNQLATEADAFEDYILNAANVDSTSKLEYVSKSYNYTDVNGTLHSGEVKSPKFEYKPYWNEDANKDGTINENDKVVVAWDADSQTYKVGPFSVNYVKGEFQTGSRSSVVFAAITEAKITTNLGELSRVSDKNANLQSGQYRFIYKSDVERVDESEFPNPDEVFYLEIAYTEGMTEINNVDFKFKYMNAGGEYHHLEGRGIEQTWTVIKNTTDYPQCHDEDCTRYHWVYSGRKYHQSYFSKTNVQLKCTGVSSKELQMFAYGVNAARWYEETSLSSNEEWEIEKEGSLKLEKVVVDESGNPVAVSEDTDFEFLVTIKTFGEDGTETSSSRTVLVTVKKGQSSGSQMITTEKWKQGVREPEYVVTEINKDGYKIKEFKTSNSIVTDGTNTATGKFSDRDTVTVSAENTQLSQSGNLKIKKIPIGDNLKDDTFYFNIYINGNLHVEKAAVNASTNWEYTTPTYTWTGDAPTYRVVEVNEEGKTISAEDGIIAFGSWQNGNLENAKTVEVYKFNMSIVKKGTIQINKKYIDSEGKEITGISFKFSVKVDGYEEQIVEVKSGETWSSEYYWLEDEPPTYTVTECEDENTIFQSIESTNGTVDGRTVTGRFDKLNPNVPISVVAINKEKSKEGKIKLTKQMVDENGNLVIADKDIPVKFNIVVTKADGTSENEEVDLTVKAGQSTATSEELKYYWKETETAPTYKVTETIIDGKYKLVDLKNGEGILTENTVVDVIAKNTETEEKQKNGKIKLTKQMVDESGNLVIADRDIPVKFNIVVTKADGTSENEEVNLTVKAGESTATSEELRYYWKETETAPRYKVTETIIDGKYKLVDLKNGEGILTENTVVDVIAKNTEVEEYEYGKIKITKQMVDDKGNLVIADKDTTFEFTLAVTKADGTQINNNVKVTVKAGQSTAESKELEFSWKKTEAAPTYKVTETKINGNYELLEIKNGEGRLSGNTVLDIVAINKVKKLKGNLKIVKNVDNDELKNVEFEVKINKDGKEYKIVKVSANKPYTEEFSWNANEAAPVVTIEEINLPVNSELVGYVNNGASLIEGKETIIVATNKTVMQKGKIQINKELHDSKGNSIDGIKFDFKLSVEGYEDKIISINSGETWRSDYYYWTSNAPKYTVTELDNNSYEFESIKSSNGKADGKSVAGVLENNQTITVSAKNKSKIENQGSIKVTKKLVAEDKIDINSVTDKFEFNVKIYYDDANKYFEYNGERYNSLSITRTVNGQGTTEPINIKWYEKESPKYYVQEINIPNNWKLKEFSNANSGNLSNSSEINVICINEQTIDRKYYFTMEMGGKVWNDTNYENGKPADTEADGIIGENEEGLSNIKVIVYKVIKNNSGKIVDKYVAGEITDSSENILKNAILYTDDNGIWKINKISVPALTEADKAKGYTKENGYSGAYDVEFTYDGQTYEPTKFLEYSNGDASKYLNAKLSERDKYLKDSMAIDNASERDTFNKKFQTISGEQAIDDNGNTVGEALNGTNGNKEELYYSSTDRQASTESSTKKVSTLDLYKENGDLYSVYEMQARTSNGGLVYPFDSKTVLKNTDTEIKFGVKTISYYYHAAYPYLNSINLGLVERKHADIALEKDLDQATVVVNGKALKYTYGEISNAQFDKYPDLLYKQIQVTDKNIEYKLNLYRSDYYYKASIYNGTEAGDALQNFYKNLGFTGKEEVELDIYLKYKITVTNESDSYDVEVKEISDYFDSDMELVSANVSKYIQDNNGKEVNAITTIADASYMYSSDGSKKNVSWINAGTITDSNSGKTYNRIVTNGLFGSKITSGDSRSIYVTFKVKKALDSTTGIDNCIRLGNKYNIAEIDSYSTYYDNGNVAGRIDEDSAPGNINVLNHNDSTWYEDDTAASPVLIIGLYDIKRQMNGLAWEDNEEKTIQYEQKVGNGQYDSGENVIPNMTTELYEKVTVNGTDYDFLWPTDSTTIPGLNGHTIQELTGLDPTINTDSEGKYNFIGITAGNYIVRFTYGDNNTINYNGQDYKSTTYQAGFNNDSNGDGIIDNQWHDLNNSELAEKRVSDARDNEARRLEVISKSQTLTYDNTSVMARTREGLEDYYMTADTAKINMNIEKNATGTESIGGITVNTKKGIIDTTLGDVGATDINYEIINMDFGLEKRSETNIALDKQIEEIKLITSSGETILDAVYDISYTGDVANVTLNSEKSRGTENLQALNNSLSAGIQGFRYINVDDTILQGATIVVRYRFTVLNTGEVDRCAEKLKLISDFNIAIADAASHNAKGIFGTYLGKVYYSGEGAMNASGECDDAIVETTVHKLVDYVDNDVVFSSTDNIIKDGSWTNTTTEQLKDMKLIDENIIDSEEHKILDENSRAYESENKNNLIISVDNSDNTQEQLTNPGFIKALKPYNAIKKGATGDYASSIELTVSRYYSSESDSENIDNLAEIIEIYNDVGRRDVDTIQGNARPSEGVFVTALKENDSSATEVITLSPPTGLSSRVIFMIQILSVVLSGIAILAVGIVLIKKKVLIK